jgi:hypothetical protein
MRAVMFLLRLPYAVVYSDRFICDSVVLNDSSLLHKLPPYCKDRTKNRQKAAARKRHSPFMPGTDQMPGSSKKADCPLEPEHIRMLLIMEKCRLSSRSKK